MKFSALILAGGRSQRMGSDKAVLEVDGQPLLARQIELVRASGATEVFVSGRVGVDYGAFGCEVLFDLYPEAGPLAGVERGLARVATPLLLVLAVDLPRMTQDYLQRLLFACTENTGAVPDIDGRLEPLVAVYPRSAHALAMERLGSGENRMQDFAMAIEETGGLRLLPVTSDEEAQFFNWNTPG